MTLVTWRPLTAGVLQYYCRFSCTGCLIKIAKVRIMEEFCLRKLLGGRKEGGWERQGRGGGLKQVQSAAALVWMLRREWSGVIFILFQLSVLNAGLTVVAALFRTPPPPPISPHLPLIPLYSLPRPVTLDSDFLFLWMFFSRAGSVKVWSLTVSSGRATAGIILDQI